MLQLIRICYILFCCWFDFLWYFIGNYYQVYHGPSAYYTPTGGHAGILDVKPNPFLVDKGYIGKDGKGSIGKDGKGSIGNDEGDIEKDKGAFIGFQEEDDPQAGDKDDGLDDIWREMSMAIECSKVWLCYSAITSKKSIVIA